MNNRYNKKQVAHSERESDLFLRPAGLNLAVIQPAGRSISMQSSHSHAQFRSSVTSHSPTMERSISYRKYTDTLQTHRKPLFNAQNPSSRTLTPSLFFESDRHSCTYRGIRHENTQGFEVAKDALRSCHAFGSYRPRHTLRRKTLRSHVPNRSTHSNGSSFRPVSRSVAPLALRWQQRTAESMAEAVGAIHLGGSK